MKLIDVHCHLESEELKDKTQEVIEAARKAGIVKLITSSVTPTQWHQSESFAKQYNEVEFTLGIHPWFASPGDMATINDLNEAKKRGAVAIGEIGLDLKIENPSLDIQIPVFEEQLEIAKNINLPVIIHNRGASNQIIKSIRSIGLPEVGGIVHSFSDSVEVAKELLDLGLSFSMGGILTYKKIQKRQKVLDLIYPHHFLLETDSPDIVPVTIDDAINVPSNILHNLEAAAKLLSKSIDEVAEVTTENAIRIFSLEI